MTAESTNASTADPFVHWCESCGREEILSTQDAFDAGWDFPPKMGTFGVISPRTCPNCLMNSTVWWAISVEKGRMDDLTPRQLQVLGRILNEVPPSTRNVRRTSPLP
ncbi:hypothetical protein [Cryobacterium sp. M91]|uniref:hypothetical protein n=1 Tax=Cryobacterium sp. M91 TaxID=2048294 RepID=UPI000CE54107|nr:hypothetical protein [Cryobacterium sp. M91]